MPRRVNVPRRGKTLLWNQLDSTQQKVRRLWTANGVLLTAVGGPAWLVSGSNGENRIDARGATQSEAWSQAVAQARALGMLDGGRRFFA
jgi:hypothetical protein